MARRGKIGVYHNKTRSLQRRLSFESFGLTYKDAEFFLYLGPEGDVGIDNISNKVFFEVPDRAYAPVAKSIPIGVEPDVESAMDFSRFGLINPLSTEKSFRIHIDDFKTLGREVIVGDVFELPFFSKDDKRALFEVTDVDLKLEYEMFIAIVKASPLSKSRRSAGIDMNRDEELLISGIMTDADFQYNEVVPSNNGVFEPEDVVDSVVDYRDEKQRSFLDDPTATFNG